MKKVLILIGLLSIFANAINYERAWKQVETYEKKRLPKSALKKIEYLYAVAKKEQNSVEYVRTALGLMKHIDTTHNNGKIKQLERMELALEEAPSLESRLILSSVLAQYYNNYLNKNISNIYARENDVKKQYYGIEALSLHEMLLKIHGLYRKSLDYKARKISIEKYADILTPIGKIQRLRPTLYDFLVFRAMDYFSMGTNYISVGKCFEFIDKKAFADAQTFMYYSFPVESSENSSYQTLLFYQEIMRYYHLIGATEALEALDLQRISFIYRHYKAEAHTEGKRYYLEALKRLVSFNPKSAAHANLMQNYYSHSNLVKTVEQAKKCMEHRDNPAYLVCEALKNKIEIKKIDISTELVNLPNENILAKVSYQNSDTIFVKVIKLSTEEKKKLVDHNRSSKLAYLETLVPLKKFALALPKSKPYTYSSTEVSLNAYEIGDYAFVFSPSKNFGKESLFKHINISNLAYFLQEDRARLLVLDRKTGEPKEGVLINATSSKGVKFEAYSDKNGFVKMPNMDKRYQISLSYKKDHLNFDEKIYPAYKKSKTSSSNFVMFFTDRAIYRPGQMVYFKGIVVKRFPRKEPMVLANGSIEITFRDRTNKQIDKKTFLTDEFGAFHGVFMTPKNGLLGTMQITANIAGSKRISVEEYKRPKFEVAFNGSSKQYQPNDTVQVSGFAKAYAGNAIDGAKVTFRVERKILLPWYRSNNNLARLMKSKLTNSGEVTTDENGKFVISFRAKKEWKIKPEYNALYQYTIYANVIDMTGESHALETVVNVSRINFSVSMNIPSVVEVDENCTLQISATGLGAKATDIKGQIHIYEHKRPLKVYRKRLWHNVVTQKMYDKEEFERLFKHYAYEENPYVKKKKLIKSINFDTARNTLVDLNHLGQGVYTLELNTSSEDGHLLSQQKELKIYDAKSKVLLDPSYLSVMKKEKNYSVGEMVRLDLKSTSADIPMLLTLEQHNKVIEEKWIRVQDKVHHEFIEIRKEHEGNVHYYLTSMKENRAYTKAGTIKVPWDTGLKIEYLSFRDKLKPNEEEQWKIKISGKNKEKVMAQMVATIYDASLDSIKQHTFTRAYVHPYSRMGSKGWNAKLFKVSRKKGSWLKKNSIRENQGVFARFKGLSFIEGWNLTGYYYDRFGGQGGDINPITVFEQEALMVPVEPIPITMIEDENTALYETSEEKDKPKKKEDAPVNIRKNLQETMFFKSDLQTDEEGNIIINFKSNEALTRWNFMAFVHSKEMKTAITHKTFITQKELMVVTNLPRFFREKDEIRLSTKVVNMSDKDLEGTCELKLLNPLTQKPIFERKFIKNIHVSKGSSTMVEFNIKVPDVDKVPAIEHTVIARTATHSDAEQVVNPILSNRIFITESKVLSLKENEEKQVVFKSLKENNSATLKNSALTLEFTSNPAWYAIRALPYLMEYPHECNEQLFSRYFANALSAHLVKSTPKIAQVFKSWQSRGALKGALSSNTELKQLLLEETPWVLNAQNENQKLRSLGLLFDLTRLAKEEDATYKKLLERQAQNADGGWAWFEAPKSSYYITQYIVSGFGKLKKLGIDKTKTAELQKAVKFLDQKLIKTYRDLERRVQLKKATWKANNISSMTINHLYARSFYPHVPMSKELKKVHAYYEKQAFDFWTSQGLHGEATTALMLNATGKKEQAKEIMNSFKERAIVTEKGMYFKYQNGYYWNQMPIETHTYMMEVYASIGNDPKSVELMQKWLLKEKFSEHWKTTTATTSAVYALFAYGSKLLENDELVDISFESTVPYQAKLKNAMENAEKGTGYFKVRFDAFDKHMGTINLKNPNNIEAYGSLYWEYFEELDKVKSFKETPLVLKRELYLMEGGKSSPIHHQKLKVGDKVKVRIELEVEKDMEYIMLKDSRASAFEPRNSLSGYRYANGLRYYQTTKDSATYFFIEKLRTGKYVFEYPLVVTHKGVFSNGISSIESMYAPEFKSHSKGSLVYVE